MTIWHHRSYMRPVSHPVGLSSHLEIVKNQLCFQHFRFLICKNLLCFEHFTFWMCKNLLCFEHFTFLMFKNLLVLLHFICRMFKNLLVFQYCCIIGAISGLPRMQWASCYIPKLLKTHYVFNISCGSHISQSYKSL